MYYLESFEWKRDKCNITDMQAISIIHVKIWQNDAKKVFFKIEEHFFAELFYFDHHGHDEGIACIVIIPLKITVIFS